MHAICCSIRRTASVLVSPNCFLLLSCVKREACSRVLAGTARAASCGGARLLARRNYQKYARSRRDGRLKLYAMYLYSQ